MKCDLSRLWSLLRGIKLVNDKASGLLVLCCLLGGRVVWTAFP